MNWVMVADPQLFKYFEGENVYEKAWRQVVGEVAPVRNSTDSFTWELMVWEADFGGKVKRFAADETKMGFFVFAIPASSDSTPSNVVSDT